MQLIKLFIELRIFLFLFFPGEHFPYPSPKVLTVSSAGWWAGADLCCICPEPLHLLLSKQYKRGSQRLLVTGGMEFCLPARNIWSVFSLEKAHFLSTQIWTLAELAVEILPRIFVISWYSSWVIGCPPHSCSSSFWSQGSLLVASGGSIAEGLPVLASFLAPSSTSAGAGAFESDWCLSGSLLLLHRQQPSPKRSTTCLPTVETLIHVNLI